MKSTAALIPLLMLGAGCFSPLSARAKDEGRPYELDWAGRTKDDHTVVCAFDGSFEGTVETHHAVAAFVRAKDRQVFGDGILRVFYRGTGESPVVSLLPKNPVRIAQAFGSVAIWCYGNNYWWKDDPLTPRVELFADFTDPKGSPFSVSLGVVRSRGWFKMIGNMPKELQARVRDGATFRALSIRGGTNVDDRSIDLNSLTVYLEDSAPLAFKSRPRRPHRIFDGQPQGLNDGAGVLPFPATPDTVIPPGDAADARVAYRFPQKAGAWDDLAYARAGGEWTACAVGGGIYFETDGRLVRAEREEMSVLRETPSEKTFQGAFLVGGRRFPAEVRFRVVRKSLVADLKVLGGGVAEVRFGTVGSGQNVRRIPVPYYSGHFVELKPIDPKDRPCVLRLGDRAARLFLTQTLDWTQSNASEPFFLPGIETAANGGARYVAKTDGRRNDCYERLVWTVSPDFAATLPNIPNPPSPHRRITGGNLWVSYSLSKDKTHERALARWRHLHRLGVRKVVITDHEVMWRDGEESFTFRTRAAPGKGGDASQARYTRAMIDELGYHYGPYNNFTDLATVNEFWSEDAVARTPSNTLRTAWTRCYNPKCAFAVNMCEKLAPQIGEKFGFSAGYCDVQSIWPPWGRVDFDARVKGAGTFAGSYYAYGEIFLMQRRAWRGPVASEGGCHYLYAGLSDQNYAQDPGYPFEKLPWIVDFDLLRIHPLECDFGMGMPYMFHINRFYRRDGITELDVFLAATVAFGHAGCLVLGDDPLASYYPIQALAATYTQATAESIRYADADGRLLTTSQAVDTGAVGRRQIVTRYSDGTMTAVNGSPDDPFTVDVKGTRVVLPPYSFLGLGGDGCVGVWSGAIGGRRAVVSVSDDYAFVDGRGTLTDTPFGATDGQLVRLPLDGGEEDVILCAGATSAVLPYAAEKVVALDEARQPLGERTPDVRGGKTYLKPERGVVSFRVKGARDLPGSSSWEWLPAMAGERN